MLYRLEGIRVRLGGSVVLDGLDFQQNPGEHLALVGRNGAGKTTLLRLIAGELEPDGGRVRRARGLRVATVDQHFAAPPGTTVLEHALGAFARLHELEAELERTVEALAERPDDAELLERLQTLQDALDEGGLYRAEAEARAVLAAFGLGGDRLGRAVETLSGGQRTRLALVRALLTPADLLLLDEPTNHLDLLGAAALAERLRERPTAILVATHDRDLIDRIAHQVVEVEGGRIRRWPAGYEAYRAAKEQADAAAVRAWERQQERIRKTEAFIRKNLAGQRTRQAQARRKELERMERLERPAAAAPPPAFVWREVPRPGDIVLAAEDLEVGHDGRTVARAGTLSLGRGERVAVVGPNGAGKTTLLRTLAGKLPPVRGRVSLGHGVVWGWYDQELADLPREGTVLDALWAVQPRWNPQELRSWLARFGFPGEAAELEVGGLSGGERGRLTLARILASGPNLLFLDEPTNHLDLPTCEALEQALAAYPGTLVLVSHDRRLLERVATRVLLVAGGTVTEHPGVGPALEAAAGGTPARRTEGSRRGGERRSPLAEEARRLRRDVRRLRERVEALEAAIEERQAAIAEGEASLADRTLWSDPGALARVQERIAAAREELPGLESEWAEAAEDLEVLEERLEAVEAELHGHGPERRR